MEKRINRTVTSPPFPINQRRIKSFAEQIVLQFHPEKVILFGSHAYGKTSSGSDVDLLIIMNTTLKPIAQEVLIRKSIPRDFPLDLIVMTPRQIDKRRKLGDAFINTILLKGKVLYGKNNIRVD